MITVMIMMHLIMMQFVKELKCMLCIYAYMVCARVCACGEFAPSIEFPSHCMTIHPHFCLHYINSRQTFVVCLLDGTMNIGGTDIVRKSDATFRCHQISSYETLNSKHENVLEKTSSYDVTFNDLYQKHFPCCVCVCARQIILVKLLKWTHTHTITLERIYIDCHENFGSLLAIIKW